jgi:uncharacterized small protein (DUF1192 family)
MKFTPEQQAELKTKIEALKAQRDLLVEEANKRVAYLNGRIDQLKALVEPEAEVDTIEQASEGD